MFHRLSKHLEFRQKYSAARRIFNSLLGLWILRWNTVARVWYITWNISYLNCGCRRKWTMTIAVIFQFKQLERRSLKNQGFNGIRTRDLRDTGAMLYQLSYEATHWERGQFIEFISPVRCLNNVKYIWNIWYLNCGCRWKWRMIIAVIFQFKQLERRSLKKWMHSPSPYPLLTINNFLFVVWSLTGRTKNPNRLKHKS